MANKDTVLKKKGGANLGLMDLNQALKEIFRHLLEYKSFVLLEIVYNDTLRQFSNIYEKNLLVQVWDKRAKIWREFNFYCHFLKFGSFSFPVNCIG